MFRFIFMVLVVLSHNVTRDASIENINSVAVVPFQVIGKVKNATIYSHGLPDVISHRLSECKNLKVLERIKLAEILQEIKLQECGFTSDDDVGKVGKMTGADIIITATIHKMSSSVRFHVKGIHVSTGQIVFSILKYFTFDEFYDFSVLENTLSADIVKAIRPEYNFDKRIMISQGSIESFQKYSEGLYYFDQGQNAKSKHCFHLSAEISTSNYWIQEIKREAKKMFKELDRNTTD